MNMPNSLTGLVNANPAIGCMKRMKQDWEKFHPEFSHFLYKNLCGQARKIIKTKLS